MLGSISRRGSSAAGDMALMVTTCFVVEGPGRREKIPGGDP